MNPIPRARRRWRPLRAGAPILVLIGLGVDDGRAEPSLVSEVDGGVLGHDIGLWGQRHVEEGVAINGNLIFAPSLEFFAGTPLHGVARLELGGSKATAGTSFAYADAIYEADLGSDFFARIGLGGAVQDGKLRATASDRKALGSRELFHIPIEAGIAVTPAYRVSIYFEHVSNGYLARPNEGLDNAGLRLGYRF